MNKTYKQQIPKLRKAGKSYKEIVEILGCAPSTVSYYLSEKTNKKALSRSKDRSDKIASKLDDNLVLSKIIATKVQTFKCSGRGYSKTYTPSNVSIQDIRNILTSNNRCYLTGKVIDPLDSNTWALDHFIPKSKGGSNLLENLKLSSTIANQAKGSMTLEEFLSLCQEVLLNFGYKISKI